ncbi:MAG: glycosyltransferase [bacterium]
MCGMNPWVSVIVPVYNDPAGLRDTLVWLVAQDFPETQFEVIVADNGSTDATRELAAYFATEHPGTVRVVVEDRIRSSYAARNAGIRASSGEVLCFRDADMTVDTDWVSSVARLFVADGPDYVGFRVDIVADRNTLAALYNRMTGFPVERYIREDAFAPTCCLAVRREVIDRVGCFDHRLVSSGDKEFGNRVKGAGFHLDYEPGIVMRHPARATMSLLLRKSYRIGKGQRRLSVLHPQQTRQPSRSRQLPGTFWRAVLALSPWRFVQAHRGSAVWHEAGWVARAGMYGLRWLCMLSYSVGWLDELLKRRGRTGGGMKG